MSRADESREYRKTEKRHLGKIAELKRRVEELKQAAGGDKEEPASAAGDIAGAGQAAEVRALCVSLVVHAVVSYRSVPRILELFDASMALGLGWAPHFTSVINWTLRLGLGPGCRNPPILDTF